MVSLIGTVLCAGVAIAAALYSYRQYVKDSRKK